MLTHPCLTRRSAELRAAARTAYRPRRRGGDRGEWRRFPHRRGQGLLCAVRRLCAGAAATGLLRPDQFLPDGAARTLSRQRPPLAAPSRPDQCVRIEGLCPRGTDRLIWTVCAARNIAVRSAMADRKSTRLNTVT